MNNPLFIIKRVTETQAGTAGVVYRLNHFPIVVSLEPPWLDNQENVSCIPPNIIIKSSGQIERPLPDYVAEMGTRKNGDRQWLLQNVQGRSRIFIHPLNTVAETAGCIGIGELFEMLGSTPGIGSSRLGFEEFMFATSTYSKIYLRIIDATRIV